MSSGSKSSGKRTDKVGLSQSSKGHSKVGSSSFTEGVSSPNVEVIKVGKASGTSPVPKSKASLGRGQALEEFMDSHRGGVDPSGQEVGSSPIVNDAMGLRDFLDGDERKGSEGLVRGFLPGVVS